MRYGVVEAPSVPPPALAPSFRSRSSLYAFITLILALPAIRVRPSRAVRRISLPSAAHSCLHGGWRHVTPLLACSRGCLA